MERNICMKRIFTLLAAILIIGLFSCKKSSPESILEGRWILDKEHITTYLGPEIKDYMFEVPEREKHELNFNGNDVTIKFNYPASITTTTYRMISGNQIEFEDYFLDGPLKLQVTGLNEFTLELIERCGTTINHYKRIN
ncbi:MAG: hypothetical protein WAT19_02655 [Ferruginibacter sp.]